MTADEILLADRPDVPGLRFRHFHGPDDFAGMAAANQETRDAAGQEDVITAASMAHDYAHFTNWDPAADTVIAERDGRIVGYARTQWRDQTDGKRAFTMIVILTPAQRGTGMAEAMLGWAEARLVAIARAIPAAERRPGMFQTFSLGNETDMAEALEARGWTRTGQGHEMVRPNLDDLPERPMPAGLVVRPVGLDEASRRRVWDAGVEAFADERDETVATEGEWHAFLTDPRQDPALWVIAFDGDEIAGGVRGLIDSVGNAHHGRERGLLDGVFTRRPWRRRGLARALTARALVRLRDHGMTSAYLGVDGLNPNQAMDLYSTLGFEIESTTYDWAKPLPADIAGDATETWLTLDGAPSIPGLRFRRARLSDDDFAALAAITVASNRADDIPFLPSAEHLREEFDDLSRSDPAKDLVIAEVDGVPIADAGVDRVVRAGVAVYETWGHVDPAWRRRGLGRTLLQENLRRIRERGAQEPDGGPFEARAHVDEHEAGHHRLVADADFKPIRWYFMMRRPNLDDIPDAPLPDGLDLRPVTPDLHRRIWEADNEAFRDHWQAREPEESDFTSLFAKADLDTSLWAVAWDGDEIAGVVQPWIWEDENRELGVQRGWLEHISVRRPWRRRGLGRALTAEGLRRLRAAGMSDAMLGVDAENPTGALGVYERLGFEVHQRTTAYQLRFGG